MEDYRGLLDEDDTELLSFLRHGTMPIGRESWPTSTSAKAAEWSRGSTTRHASLPNAAMGSRVLKTLWNRLCLDVNLATRAVGNTVRGVKALIQRIRLRFLAYYT